MCDDEDVEANDEIWVNENWEYVWAGCIGISSMPSWAWNKISCIFNLASFLLRTLKIGLKPAATFWPNISSPSFLLSFLLWKTAAAFSSDQFSFDTGPLETVLQNFEFFFWYRKVNSLVLLIQNMYNLRDLYTTCYRAVFADKQTERAIYIGDTICSVQNITYNERYITYIKKTICTTQA